MKGATAAPDARYSGMRPLSGVLETRQVMRRMRDASLAEAAGPEPEPEHVYSIGSNATVVVHTVTRKTDKTIWYDHPGRWRWKFAWTDITLPDGTTGREYRFAGGREWNQPEPSTIQRQRLERDGRLCKCFTTGTVSYCSLDICGKDVPATHYIYTTREAAEQAMRRAS